MPFTIDGSWVPSKPASENIKPVKVRLVKRGKSILTVILNLNKPEKELLDLASLLKKKLGSGGALKEETIEIQGDKVNEVLKLLKELGIKAS
ncbi:translation initiation factor [Criblamydia sequanensis]|uniref:Protein translation factor n=1 Tax=Candidatus Criblamydia sequanensis CRIB-18 TaxID=1437425 RepID=A0A090E3W2_9BACT|nr:translation initiation factor [Criblamydia sequanensis]CDR35224.1 Protein translation factor [Criblamydia sequanensis CRIB-18]